MLTLLFAVVSATGSAFSADVLDALTRVATVAAAQDARFDVISALDVDELKDFEAEKQATGSTAESHLEQVGGAYDARLVVFLSAFRTGELLQVELKVRDLKAGRILHRDVVDGADEAALLAAVRAGVARGLERFTDHPATGTTRVFIGRASSSRAAVAPLADELERVEDNNDNDNDNDNVDDAPRTRGGAALRSLVLPGWGQGYNGQPVKGVTFGVITGLLGATTLITGGLGVSTSFVEYPRADGFAEAQELRNRGNAQLLASGVFGVLTAAAWTVQVADAWLVGVDEGPAP